jgi:hypothetical protein
MQLILLASTHDEKLSNGYNHMLIVFDFVNRMIEQVVVNEKNHGIMNLILDDLDTI